MKKAVDPDLPTFENLRPKLFGSRWVRAGVVTAALGLAVMAEPIIGCASSSTAITQNRVHSVINGQESQEEAKKAFDSANENAPTDTKEYFSKVPENFKKAAELVKKLKLSRQDALTKINFAYAISAIGEKRTTELYQNLGIEYFMRYSKKTLDQLYENMGLKCECGKPMVLAVFNKNDWNGHFYREGMDLEPLLQYYKLMIVEVDGEDGLYSRLGEISESYGKIDTLIIAGHGSPGSIQLGKNDEKGEIDLTDGEELLAVKKDFTVYPTVILVSCSTGEDNSAIGALLSKSWDAKVIAPIKPITKTYYHLDDSGRLERVTYDVDTNDFINGLAK